MSQAQFSSLNRAGITYCQRKRTKPLFVYLVSRNWILQNMVGGDVEVLLTIKNFTWKRRTFIMSVCVLSVAAITLLIGGCRFIKQLIFSVDYAVITEEISTRPTERGERFFERWITVDYFGDDVLLSANPDGSGDIWVDDALLIEVVHPDGTQDQKTIDFSFGCQGWISSLPPQALNPLFMIGRNRVHIIAYDICGSMIGSSRLCLYMKQGRIIEMSPLTVEWRWPTNNPYIVQEYGNLNPYAGNKQHTGVDIRDSTVNCAQGNIGGCSDVYASASGIVVAVCPNGRVCPGFSTNTDNHNMQGVVILEHVLPEGRILYSLYAHLGKINPVLRVGQFVNLGSYLGTTGVFLRDGRWVSHVHFEIKDAAVLHNPKGGNACAYNGEPGPCWGYTPGNPDNYGYHNPKEFIGGFTQTSIYAVSVKAFDICHYDNNFCDPTEAEGPPDETFPWTGRFVSLGGIGGYIEAAMESEFINGPGVDLRIYEVGDLQGGKDEIFDVFVSADGKEWTQVADDIKNDEGQYFASINLPINGHFKYVKIVNQSPFTESPTPGADIDAIEALWASTD